MDDFLICLCWYGVLFIILIPFILRHEKGRIRQWHFTRVACKTFPYLGLFECEIVDKDWHMVRFDVLSEPASHFSIIFKQILLKLYLLVLNHQHLQQLERIGQCCNSSLFPIYVFNTAYQWLFQIAHQFRTKSIQYILFLLGIIVPFLL